MTKLNEIEPNMANPYKQAYDRLLALAPESLRLKVLAAKGNDTLKDSDVDKFVKRVIALAEQDDK